MGAAVPSVIGKATDWPRGTVVPEGRLMAPGLVTVTAAVAFATLGALVLAVMVAEPGATAVTTTLTLFAFAGMVTEAGTVAAAALLELRLIVRADGVGDDRFKDRF